MHRPSSRLNDRQDVRSKRIADHEETLWHDAVTGEDGGVDVRRLVADDFHMTKAADQARAFELRSLVEEIPFGDQHQRPGGR